MGQGVTGADMSPEQKVQLDAMRDDFDLSEDEVRTIIMSFRDSTKGRKSKVISFEVFRKIMAKHLTTADSSVQEAHIRAIFHACDIDGNGHVEFKEWARLMLLLSSRMDFQDRVRFAMECYDLNHDGVLDREEIRSMLLVVFKPSQFLGGLDEAVEQFFRQYDTDGNGVIDLEEFQAIVLEHSEFLTRFSLFF